MDEMLTIQQAAKRLGVSVDTLREWERAGRLKAERTVGGHRRFRASDVAGSLVARGGTQGSTTESTTPGRRRTSAGQSQNGLGSPFWQERAREARARTDVLRSRSEARGLLAAHEAERTRSIEAAAEAQQREQHRSHLEALKEYGRSVAAVCLPSDWRVEVTGDLERFVTPERFPPSLSASDGREFVAAHVQAILRRYHEQRAQEDARKQREHQRALQQVQVAQLIQSGNECALQNTLLWDAAERVRARREVEERLREEVRPRWTHEEVHALVAEVLGEWEPSGEGEDYEAEDAEEDDDEDEVD